MAQLEFDRNFEVQPGAVERISPLVRRVLCANPGPFTFKGTSTFIVGNGKTAIIDPGPDDEAHLAALFEAVRGETVTHILVTHSHADHSSLAVKLQQATGAKIVGYGPAAMGDPQAPRLDASIDRHFDPELRMNHADTLSGPGWTLEGVFTPGHMSNHMCFALHEEKSLFAGDHVMAWSTSVVAPPDGNMADYMASLGLLLDRDDEFYLPAHGPARRDPKPLVRGYIAHRRMRERAILNRIKAGAATIPSIVAAVYSDIDPKLHGAAALSTEAHIEHLITQGLVRANERGYEAV